MGKRPVLIEAESGALLCLVFFMELGQGMGLVPGPAGR